MSSELSVDLTHLAQEVRRFCRTYPEILFSATAPFSAYYRRDELQRRHIAAVDRESRRVERKGDSLIIHRYPAMTWAERQDWISITDPLHLLHHQFRAAVSDSLAQAERYRSSRPILAVQARQAIYLFWLMTDEVVQASCRKQCMFYSLPWRARHTLGRDAVHDEEINLSRRGGDTRSTYLRQADFLARCFDNVVMNSGVVDIRDFKPLAPVKSIIEQEEWEAGVVLVEIVGERDPALDDVDIFGASAPSRETEGAVSDPRAPAIGLRSKDLSASNSHRGMGLLTTAIEREGSERLMTMRISLDRGPERPAIVGVVRGRTVVNLAKLVLGSPDQDHTWASLLNHGLQTGLWTITSPSSLRRSGSRIKAALPPELKGCWTQSTTGVRWTSPG